MEQLILRYSITHLSLSPSFAEIIYETCGITPFLQLKFLGVAGEEFPSSLANSLAPAIKRGCRIFNLYGPSETTIYATAYELVPRSYHHVPIGTPFNGVEVKTIAHKNNLGLGELLIGGCGVTMGYLHHPELTKEKFVCLCGQRFYKTGDFVHYDEDDLLIFDGRMDRQVQINGIRVELDAIKSIALSVSGVCAVQVAYQDGKIYIFYEADCDKKSDILNELPSYLKPIVVQVDDFILNQNRKLDVPTMVKHYYLTSSRHTIGEIAGVIRQTLAKYGVREPSELDSLDTIRFVLDLEDLFDVKIGSDALPFLKSTDDVVSYVSNLKGNQRGITQFQKASGSPEIARHLDALVIGMGAKNYQIPQLEDLLEPTCTQERFFDTKNYSLTSVEVKLQSGSIAELNRTRKIIKTVSYQIDILRMALTQHDGNIRLGVIAKEAFQPQIYIVIEPDVSSLIKDVLPECKTFPVPFITYSVTDQCLRFYFAYHTMDAHSLHLLSNILYQAINESRFEFERSSFSDFRHYIETANNNVRCENYFAFLPQSDNLHFKPLGEKLQVISITRSDEKEPLPELSLWCIFQEVIQQRSCKVVTGALSYNLRHFEEFDATNVIGDVHTKCPVYSVATESFDEFLKRFKLCLDVYRKGIDLRWIATRQHLSSQEQILYKRWHALNFSANYLGIVLDSSAMLDEIKKAHFEANFINLFLTSTTMVCTVGQQVLNEGCYEFRDNGIQYCLRVHIE